MSVSGMAAVQLCQHVRHCDNLFVGEHHVRLVTVTVNSRYAHEDCWTLAKVCNHISACKFLFDCSRQQVQLTYYCNAHVCCVQCYRFSFSRHLYIHPMLAQKHICKVLCLIVQVAQTVRFPFPAPDCWGSCCSMSQQTQYTSVTQVVHAFLRKMHLAIKAASCTPNSHREEFRCHMCILADMTNPAFAKAVIHCTPSSGAACRISWL